MKVYEQFAGAVIAEGVEAIFAVMGDGNMRLLNLLESKGMKVYYCRHEASAVAMAEGYARASGKLGVASVTCGPGLALTGLTLLIGSRNRTPLLVIAGDSPRGDRYYNQNFDQRRFAEACEAMYFELSDPAFAGADLREAFVAARTGGPTVFGADFDVQETEAPASDAYSPSTALMLPYQRVRPDRAALERAAGVLSQAQRPIIIAGRGAFDARDAILALQARTGALLATTMHGKGLFDGHPANLGLAGGFSSPKAKALFERADCVLAVGASLNYYTTNQGRLFPAATSIQIDRRPLALINGLNVGRGVPAGPMRADLYLEGDARATLEELELAIAASVRTPGWPQVLAELEAPPPGEHPFAVSPGELHPRDVMRVIAAAAPKDAYFVIGLGHFWWFAWTFLGGSDAHRFHAPIEFGSIGQGLCSAIGAAIALPDRQVILVEGDGGFLMSIQELDTAARYSIPLIAVVMDDAGLGAEFHKLEAKGLDPGGAKIRPPDFAAVAVGFGANGIRVTTLADLEAAIQRYKTEGRPAIIDVNISQDVVSDPYLAAHYPTALSSGSKV